MSLFIIILLVVFFAYSIALVLANNSEVAVNLLFSQLPNTNLGLVLILTIALGVLIGILIAILLFKVLQNKFEIHKLKKDVDALERKLNEANTALDSARQLAQTHQAVVNEAIQPTEVPTTMIGDTKS